jgi:hypothetical protein
VRCTVVALAALAAAGCGGGSAAKTAGRSRAAAALAGPCAQAARTALAGATGISDGAIATTRYAAPDGSAACRFTGAGGRLAVTVEIDSAPQAYYVFDKRVVEYSQTVVLFHKGERAYPRPIFGLGLGADWFAADDELLTTDGVRIVSVVVTSRPPHAKSREALAEVLARPYLGPLRQPFR